MPRPRKRAIDPIGTRTERLPCELTDGDRLRLLEELRALHRDDERVAEERRDMLARWRERRAATAERRAAIMADLASGTEARDVGVEEVIDGRFNMRRVIRLDNGQVVSERPLTREERQLDLELVAGGRAESA